MYFKFKKNI